jgi:putative oxidoreductase
VRRTVRYQSEWTDHRRREAAAMMLENVAVRTFVPILLRFALAAVFIYHGLEKVMPENGYGLSWMKAPDPSSLPPNAPPPKTMPVAVQGAVAWGELLGGAACALGLFTRLAALGLAAIMVGAIVTVTGPLGFSIVNKGFEYNLVLILVCASLILLGPGLLSLDRVIRVKMRGPAEY